MNSVAFRVVSVGVATGISDFVWARYISAIANVRALEASTWGAIVIVLGAYVVISYVGDKRLILPAAIGAFIGTYLAV